MIVGHTLKRSRTIAFLTPRLSGSLCGNRLLAEVLLARISRSNHGADGFLIEPFEAAMALKIFEVTADGAFPEELLALSGRYQAVG